MAEILSLIPDLTLAPQVILDSGYDPIASLVSQDRQLEATINAILLTGRPSMVAVAQLMAQRVNIGKELLKYRYKQAALLGQEGPRDENPVINISM